MSNHRKLRTSLFNYRLQITAPWILVTSAALLILFVWVAVYFRMQAAFSENEQFARNTMQASAEALEDTLSQASILLRQSSKLLEITYSNRPEEAISEGDLGFASLVAAYDRTLRPRNVVPSTHFLSSPVTDTLIRQFITSKSNLKMMNAVVEPSTGELFVPILSKSNDTPNAMYFVYVLPAKRLTAIINKSFPFEGGTASLVDKHSLARVSLSLSGHPLSRAPDTATPTYIEVHGKGIPSLGYSVDIQIEEREISAKVKADEKSYYYLAGCISAALLSFTILGLLIWRHFLKSGKKLKYLACTDTLTGLPNRHQFNELLVKAITIAESSKKLGLLFIDLDNFKYVNDSLGHDAGDILLRQVARRLESSVRSEDIVCRLGGDEFTVVLPDLNSLWQAESVAQRIVEAMCNTFEVNGNEVHAHVSIGLALMSEHAKTASELMRFADAAMYRAKKKGKSCYCVYDDSMTLKVLAREKMSSDLQSALLRNELFLVYQPKVDLESGKVSSYEALVRWSHPTQGLIHPAVFIPLAEESGAIIDIGQWVIREAVKQLNVWSETGHGWKTVSVNVSALQLRSKKLAKTVRSVLREYAVPGWHLQLELTESLLVTDTQEAKATISQLRDLGVSIAIDDFGTGYSSLSILQEFDINCLKVDRSFVNALGTESGDKICLAIVNLAHSLGLSVVAEGIETVAQYQQLMDLGCEEGQGFFFSKPLLPLDAGHYFPDVLLFPNQSLIAA